MTSTAAMPGACGSGGARGYPREDAAALPMQRDARYEYRRVLGEGGSGVVSEVWDRQLRREIAVKRIPLDASAGDAWLEEARFSALLGHPAFVVVHDVWRDATHGHIAMEFVNGQPLSLLIPAGPVSPPRALDLMAQACEAFGFAHDRGIVHGDIKPSNLMLDTRGRLRILDFGIATRIDPLRTRPGGSEPAHPGGTLAYMPPEQLMGEPPSIRGDVYSLGQVIQELLLGRPVHPADDPLRIAHRKLHRRAVVELPALVPPGFARVLDEMTQREPARRLASMVAARMAVADATTPAASAARPHAAPLRTMRRTLLTLAFAVLGTISGGAAPEDPDEIRSIAASPDADLRQLTEAERLLRGFDEEGAVDRAAALAEAVLRRNPHRAAAAATLSLAQSLRYSGDQRDASWLKRAEVGAALALSEDDQLSAAHAAAAWVSEFQGRHDAAEASYRRALALDPRQFQALQGLARMLAKLRRHEEARRVLDAALAAYPADRVFLDGLGALLFAQGDQGGAERLFRASIAARPTSVFGYANLAAVLLHAGRDDEALDVLQQGLRLRPHSRLYDNLGTILFAKGRYLEAAQAFERAVSSSKGSPNDYLDWANLADALRWIPGREDDAQAAYRRALQLLDPGEGGGREAVVYSRGALYAAHLGDGRARNWLATALAKAPDAADVRFRAAIACELMADHEHALEHLLAATKLGYPAHLTESEPELAALRRDDRYQQLMAKGTP